MFIIKEIKLLLVLAIGFLIFMSYALADQYHPAEELRYGTFGGTNIGDYTFPRDLTVKRNLKFYDGSSIGSLTVGGVFNFQLGKSPGYFSFIDTSSNTLLKLDKDSLYVNRITGLTSGFDLTLMPSSTANSVQVGYGGTPRNFHVWGDTYLHGNLNVDGKIYGWNVPSDVKMTSTIHNGNFVTGSNGYQDMKTWIQSNGCSGYHVCSASELTAWAQNGGMISGSGYCWYNSGVMDSEGGAWYNDCDGWTNWGNTFGGNIWQTNTPRLVHTTCSQSFPVCCCK